MVSFHHQTVAAAATSETIETTARILKIEWDFHESKMMQPEF